MGSFDDGDGIPQSDFVCVYRVYRVNGERKTMIVRAESSHGALFSLGWELSKEYYGQTVRVGQVTVAPVI